jgi:hypothetical protein
LVRFELNYSFESGFTIGFIDATCVCATSSGGQCVLLAQSLLDLAEPTAELFSINLTAPSLALSTWDALGKPTDGTCEDQAQLIDVSKSLDSSRFPIRSRWAQAALVYTLYQSGNASETESFRSWIADTNFASLNDGPSADPDGHFAHGSLGYLFDLAMLNVTPPDLTYPMSQSGGTVPPVSSTFTTALNKLYSFAVGT